MILIIEHIKVEGPGTIESYFKERGSPLKTIALHKGDRFPRDISDVRAVIAMGGPMNVYEEDRFPFLKDENVFIKKILKQEIPFLGVCLGSQLLARACGARVIKSPVKEIGWFKVDLSEEGKKDALFENVESALNVYHWHEDMWELSKDASLLATGSGCPNQAFKVGSNAYGLQFHIEITGEIIKDWCEAYFDSGDERKTRLAQEMIEAYPAKKKDLSRQANAIYGNFEKIMKERWV